MTHSPDLPAETSGTTVYRLDRSVERSSFQCYEPYSPAIDIRSDVAIVYGVDDTLTSRIAEWKRQGYRTHMMTGSAWGEYEAYIDGRFDGTPHADEGQVDGTGATIWHHPGVPYMVPTPSFVRYLSSLARRAIDAGAEALHFEEPEFWSRAGYSEGFRKVWKAEYGTEWQRPDSSPDAFWRASKLKYLLYKRALEEVFAASKEYARSRGRSVRCFVPTHSLLNYAQWGIVSPESSLMDLPNCDGYIAQVWTGTARQRNLYRGVAQERTFESAFLEYASMHSMTAPTGRTVYFLADPVEDDPKHTWDDYRMNYERVVAASLLFPGVSHFEVMPWPNRVMTAPYPAGSYAPNPQTSAVPIPPSYASELMTVINALSGLGREKGEVRWECGSSDLAVLASDTLMFQRGSQWEGDPFFSGFFGLAMPLVKAGIPARCVILERVLDTHAFQGVRVLLASYETMKPMRPEYHDALAQWVRRGGILLYFGDDSDPFHGVQEWWNAGHAAPRSPRADLFARLGLGEGAGEGFHPVDKGLLVYSRQTPAKLAGSPGGADTLLALVAKGMERQGAKLSTSNALVLHRGSYVAGGVLSESASTAPLRLTGRFADLFSPEIATVTDPAYSAGSVFLLRRLADSAADTSSTWVASNLRVEQVEQLTAEVSRVTLRGPTTVREGLCRLAVSSPYRRVELEGSSGAVVQEWKDGGHSVLLRFPYSGGDVRLRMEGKAPPVVE